MNRHRASRRALLAAVRRYFVAGVLLPVSGVAAKPARIYRLALVTRHAKPAGAEDPDPPPSMRPVFARHGFTRENLRLERTYLGTYPVYPPADALASIMRTVVKSAPDVILATGAVLALQAARATKSIPIVFWHASDAVIGPLVAELRRPGLNVTGVMLLRRELHEKRLELARDLMPAGERRVGVVANYAGIERDFKLARDRVEGPGYVDELRAAVDRAGMKLVEANLNDQPDQVARAVDIALAGGAKALVLEHALPRQLLDELHELSIRHRLPLITGNPNIGVASVGTDGEDHARRTAEMLVRVLKGGNPAEIPVDRDTRFSTTLNLAVARAIGLAIPPVVRVRADRTIE